MVIDKVFAEMERQDEKYGAGRHQPDPLWFLIMAAEFGEMAKAILNNMHGRGSPDEVEKELVHTVAVGMQWLLDKDDNQAHNSV